MVSDIFRTLGPSAFNIVPRFLIKAIIFKRYKIMKTCHQKVVNHLKWCILRWCMVHLMVYFGVNYLNLLLNSLNLLLFIIFVEVEAVAQTCFLRKVFL